MARKPEMKIRKILLITLVVLCVFSLGFYIGKITTIAMKPKMTTQKKSLVAFNIPQVPLPPDWSQKENLPGNSFETAIPLTIGFQTQGTINENNVIDYYSFVLKSPSKVIFDITNVPKSLYWILYDNTHKEIASSYRTGLLSGSSQVSLQNPETYYIKVWADYSQWTNYPYTIRLSILPFVE